MSKLSHRWLDGCAKQSKVNFVCRVRCPAQLPQTRLIPTRRIQTAIQRYFRKRNLNSERKDVFDKYMAYGGIDAGPKMFSGGLDAKANRDSTAAEIAAMSATHFVPIGRGEQDDANFVVDFEGCAQGFL